MSRFVNDKEHDTITITGGSESPLTVAGSELTSTASQAYTKGQYLVFGGLLYQVTAAIAQGDTLTPGTNIAVTTVGTQLTTIENNLKASNATAGVSEVPFRFGVDDDGNFGYIINEGGADTVIPFKSGGLESAIGGCILRIRRDSGQAYADADVFTANGTVYKKGSYFPNGVTVDRYIISSHTSTGGITVLDAGTYYVYESYCAGLNDTTSVKRNGIMQLAANESLIASSGQYGFIAVFRIS